MMPVRSRPQLKTSTEIAKLREANLVVAEVLDEVGARVAPGVSTWELEETARAILKKHGATSAFLGYQPGRGVPPYPAVLCTSRNEAIVHGIPRKDDVLEEGDILSVDFGAFLDGWCGDAARTFPVGTVSEEAAELLRVTEESLWKAIEKVQVGNRLGDVSYAVQAHCEAHGFSVVEAFVGHGIGRSRAAAGTQLWSRGSRPATESRSGHRHRANGERGRPGRGRARGWMDRGDRRPEAVGALRALGGCDRRGPVGAVSALGSRSQEETDDEGTSVCSQDLRQVQDHQAQGRGAGNL